MWLLNLRQSFIRAFPNIHHDFLYGFFSSALFLLDALAKICPPSRGSFLPDVRKWPG